MHASTGDCTSNQRDEEKREKSLTWNLVTLLKPPCWCGGLWQKKQGILQKMFRSTVAHPSCQWNERKNAHQEQYAPWRIVLIFCLPLRWWRMLLLRRVLFWFMLCARLWRRAASLCCCPLLRAKLFRRIRATPEQPFVLFCWIATAGLNAASL